MTLTIGSLFSGIGGLDERWGITRSGTVARLLEERAEGHKSVELGNASRGDDE